jgi:hypothetical protein
MANEENLTFDKAYTIAKNVSKWEVEKEQGNFKRIYSGKISGLDLFLKSEETKNFFVDKAILEVYCDGLCLYRGTTQDDSHEDIFKLVDKPFREAALKKAEDVWKRYAQN